MQRDADETQYQHVDADMADVLVAEDAAEGAEGPDHGGDGGEVAVEDSPGGWKAPGKQDDDVDADDAEDSGEGEGLRGHQAAGSVGRRPGLGEEEGGQAHGGGEEDGREEAAELWRG